MVKKVFIPSIDILWYSWRRIQEGFNLKIGFRDVKIVFVILSDILVYGKNRLINSKSFN